MEPPWKVDPDYFADGLWVLGKGDYIKAWRQWFVALPEGQKADYRESHPPIAHNDTFYDVFGVPPYDPVREAEKYRDDEGFLTPPWLAFPHIGLGSIGWRMGAGEDYWHVFADWYNGLDAAGKIAMRDNYPEPVEVIEGHPWTGFYGRLEKYK